MVEAFDVDMRVIEKSFAKADDFVRYDAEMARRMDLSEETRKWLSEMGLPTGMVLMCRFNGRIRRLGSGEAGDYQVRMRGGEKMRRGMCVIGHHEGELICLNEGEENRVWLMDRDWQEKPRLFGSDVGKLVELLAIYVQYRRRVMGLSGFERKGIAVRMGNWMKVTDVGAFEGTRGEETVWECITRQMIEGSL